MGRLAGIKWDKTLPCRPNHNIISSDFPKYYPQPWKFMEGPSRIQLLLSYEYQRLWIDERDQWKKRMFPENLTENVDIVKKYVLSFKNIQAKPKPEKKKTFMMKKFQNVKGATSTKRSHDDKAMSYLKKDQPTAGKPPKEKKDGN